MLDLHGQLVGGQLAADQLRIAQEQLYTIQARSDGLAIARAQLGELQQTARIARRNMTRSTPSGATGGNGWSLFDRDQELAKDLIDQVDSDLVYLDALRERMQAAHNLASSRIRAVAEQRHTQRVLLQTTFFGALLAALTAVQALQVTIPMRGESQWLLVALVTLLALALPSVALRQDLPSLPSRLARILRPQVPLLAAAGVAFTLVLVSAWRLGTGHAAPWPVMTLFLVLTAAVTTMLAVRKP